MTSKKFSLLWGCTLLLVHWSSWAGVLNGSCYLRARSRGSPRRKWGWFLGSSADARGTLAWHDRPWLRDIQARASVTETPASVRWCCRACGGAVESRRRARSWECFGLPSAGQVKPTLLRTAVSQRGFCFPSGIFLCVSKGCETVWSWESLSSKLARKLYEVLLNLFCCCCKVFSPTFLLLIFYKLCSDTSCFSSILWSCEQT